MKRVIFPLICGLALLAASVSANAGGLFIAGPQGCKLLDGVVISDAGAGVFLQEDHWFLDYEQVEGWQITCWFDGMFSLTPEPGTSETLPGQCETWEGQEMSGSFTLTYPDAASANLAFSKWDAPLAFTLCPME